MIKQIPYDLGSKGVTCSAIDFESTAGRLPSPPEPQWAGVLLTSQSPRPEGSVSSLPLVAQGNGTGRCKQKVLHPAGETATPRQDPDPASLEGGAWLGQASRLHCQQAPIPQLLEGMGLYPPAQGALL